MKKLLSLIGLYLGLVSVVQAQQPLSTKDNVRIQGITDKSYSQITAIKPNGSENILTIGIDGGKDDEARRYTAFNFDFELPPGFEVITNDSKCQIGMPHDFSLYAESENQLTHSAMSRLMPDGKYRVIGYSSSNKKFTSAKGALVDCCLRINSPYVKPGVNKISFSGINFTIQDSAQKFIPQDIELDVVVGEGDISLNLTLEKGSYSTCIFPFDAQIPEGLKVFSVENYSGTKIYLKEVTSIQAYEPYFIYATKDFNEILSGQLSQEKYNAKVVDGKVTSDIMCGAISPQEISSGYLLTTNYLKKTTQATTIPSGKCWITTGSRSIYTIVSSVNEYDLVFMDGQDTIQASKQGYGTTIVPPTAPEKEGYTFVGWENVDSVMPDKATTYNAIYKINQYRLNYMVDGQEYKSDSVAYGEKVTALANPEKEGYTFSGWSEVPGTMPANDVTINGTFTINKYVVTFKVDGEVFKSDTLEYNADITVPQSPEKVGFTFSGWSNVDKSVPARDVTYEASFTVNQYTVTFMADGKVVSEGKQEYGSAITAPEAPAKEGYTFVEWKGLNSTTPAQNSTYEAVYKINKYVVTFISEGQTLKSDSLEYGSAITAPATPTKEGYTFMGWSPAVSESVPASDVTYTAQFSVNKYKIIYMVDGQEYKSDSVAYGEKVTALANPEKEGYTFSGWSEVPGTMPANDVTINGTFTINKYVVTFKVDGEVFRTDTLEYNASITIPQAPEKVGYTFSGWTNVDKTVPAKDVTYEASFTVNQYTMSFVIDGITVSKADYDYGTIIVPPTIPEKEGYTFIGWYPELDKTVPAKDMYYEAQYKVNVYKLTYIVDGEEYQSDSIAYGSSITAIAEPEKEGYTFSGWSEIPSTMPAKDVTITGTFTKNQSAVKKGDVTGDGVINVGDLTALITMVMNDYADKDDKFTAGDMNADGVLNVGDITSLVSMIMSASAKAQDAADEIEAAADANTLYVPALENVKANSKDAVMSVEMVNADAISAFQFDLETPEGISVAVEDDFLAVELSTARTTAKKHVVESQAQKDGSVRVLLYSNKNYDFSGNSGEVCTIGLAIGAVADGVYDCTLKNIALSTATSVVFTPAEVTAKIGVGMPVGVNNLKTTTTKMYYNLEGKPLSQPQRGINVVRYPDGSTKKIYVR